MNRERFGMRLIFRTSAFQLAMVYAAVFLVSTLAVVGVLYWATIGSVSRQVDATIATEIVGLAEQYERQGINGLVDVLEERVARSPDFRAIYLFADAGLRPVAGNLKRWPSAVTVDQGRIEFDASDGGSIATRYRASVLTVGRYHLLVGRDVREISQLDRVFRRTAIWGVSLVLVLALAGGTLTGFGARRRLASINRTVRQIMVGDLAQRVPVSGSRDEYDDLANNINAMLTQIELLLESLRHVGDSIAHDLKTPLTRLRNRLESLAGPEGDVSTELQKCVADSDRLLTTFNALLRISRIESGAYRTAFSIVDVAQIVNDAADLYKAAAEAKDVSLDVHSASSVTLNGDRELLSQAVANVLDNAVKYAPEGGRITVAIDRQEDRVEIAVTDNGAGVPVQDHDRIQQRFVRLDSARSTPGNGLGLALVKAVVDQHRGRLLFENLEPGLKVVLVLPRNDLSRADIPESDEFGGNVQPNEPGE